MRDRLRRAAPALLGLTLLGLFFAATLDPRVQLYYRDTGRLYYPVKLFIARQLRAGRLPLWDPMTEAGVSLLGQVTPGLFHPATLLYLVFPFDLAFKLNHLLGPLLGGIGAWRLARRLDASPWSRLAAAIAYAGCGYLISVTGSNLPYALGAGSVPVAVDAVLGFVEAPSAGRFAWAGAAVALIAFAGEPQAMLMAGLIAGAWALAAGGTPRGAARNVGLVAASGALALAFSAPAVLPALTQLRRSNRAAPLTERERAIFANHPFRLAGLLVPRAFDDTPEVTGDAVSAESAYTEYFTEAHAAFADSIVFGAPALLLAGAAAFAGRKGRLLVGGAVLLLLCSTGAAFGIDRIVFAPIPFANVFRYAEKLTAPASLLLALAAAVGTEFALAGSRRASFWLAASAVCLAISCAAGSWWIASHLDALADALVPAGKTHRALFATTFWREARGGLRDAALLSAALAAVALFRWSRRREARPLAALCCAAAVFASSGGLLYSAPIEYVRGPFDLAERLKARAGPSPGRWRLFVNDRDPRRFGGLPVRAGITFAMGQALLAQFETTAGIEGIASYFSAGDPVYSAAIRETPETYFNLFGVRFAVEMPSAFSAASAARLNFHRVGYGYWVREYPVLPRAFTVERAVTLPETAQALAHVAAPGFDVRREAVLHEESADDVHGSAGPASLERISAEHLRVRARGPGLLVVGEHFDPGWAATVDGKRLPVLQADLAALGVVLPAGEVVVDLRFIPKGLVAGTGIAAAAALAIALWRALAGRRSALTKRVTAPTDRV